MFLMLAAILMVGIGLCNFVPRGCVSPHPVGKRRQGLRSLALAIALGLVSIPTSAWANAPGENSAQILRGRPAVTASIATEARAPQDQDYASREASAKGLEFIIEVDRSLTHEPSWIRYVNRVLWEAARSALPGAKRAK